MQNIKAEPKTREKPVKIDERDRKIFNLLNKNARLTLKEIAKEVGMSMDGVKGRIGRMVESGAIIKFAAIPEPKFFGLPVNTQVYVKLKNITEEGLQKFKNYLKSHERVMLFMSVVGDFDIYFVLLGKSANEIYNLKNEIRQKFSDLIADWREVVTAEIFKYEEYSF